MHSAELIDSLRSRVARLERENEALHASLDPLLQELEEAKAEVSRQRRVIGAAKRKGARLEKRIRLLEGQLKDLTAVASVVAKRGK
jgi:chromosome segregation ATPase